MTQLNPKRVLLLVIFVITLGQTAQLATSQPVSGTLTEGIGANGQINWTEGVIIVTGQSAINPKFANNPAQQKLMAMRFAQVDAYRNLAEVVNGIRVASSSYMKDMVGESDEVRVLAEGFGKGAKVHSTEISPEGIATVSLIAPLNGKGGLANFIFPDKLTRVTPPYPLFSELSPPQLDTTGIPPNLRIFLEALEARIVAIERFLAEQFGYRAPTASTHPTSQSTTLTPDLGQIYTGLIIDAKGLKVKPAMSPRVLDEGGQEVYGTGYVSREYAVEQGIVGYSKSIESAKQNKRAGNKPFVVKGLKASGANNTDIVISNTDAQTVLGMKGNLSFLDRCRVMVVVD